ncbi:MAG: GspE/PulE family protein [Patescibacteria group bacterium]
MKGLIEALKKRDVINQQKYAELEKRVKSGGKSQEDVILNDPDLSISENELFKIKSDIINVPFKENVNLDKLGSILPDIANLIPEDSAKHYKMVPLNKNGKTIEIGMVFPKDLKAQEVLHFLSRRGNFSYDIKLITFSTFNDILNQYGDLRKGAGAALGAMGEEEQEIAEEAEKAKEEDVEKMAEEAPIVRVVSVILKEAVEGGASDIHIEPGREKLEVRYRIDGVLHSSLILPIKIHQAVIARIKILSNLKIEERRLPQDGRFFSKIAGKNIDFRVATMPTTLGEKVVLRVLDPDQGMMSVSELGMRKSTENIVQRGIDRPTGMILATGPTGSGKTTTLYSLLKVLNTEEVNIVTLEDPVEYFIEGVNQSQIKHEIGYDFSNGLRQILRQDPDIIMVGEIRDQETAELAVHAALTGHIVLSTLHTNDAVGVIPRLIDMGIKPYLVPPSLNTAIAQRLVRKLCDNCKKEERPEPEVERVIKKEIESLPPQLRKRVDLNDIKIYKPVGCDKCGSTGFSGRIGIFEALEMTDQMSKLILKDRGEDPIKKQAFEQGMITMRQDGILKALEGKTSVEVVLKATKETKKETKN